MAETHNSEKDGDSKPLPTPGGPTRRDVAMIEMSVVKSHVHMLFDILVNKGQPLVSIKERP